MSEQHPSIKSLKQRYLFYRLSEIVLKSGAFACIVYATMPILFGPNDFDLAVAIVFFVGFALALFFSERLHQLSEAEVIRYLNQRYNSLEHSADLMLKNPDELNGLQALQRERVLSVFHKLYPEIQLPHHLQRSALIFMAGLLASFLMSSFLSPTSIKKAENSKMDSVKNITPLPAVVTSSLVVVTPPAYTGIKSSSSPNLDLNIPEGSTVRWKISFSDAVRDAKLIFSGRDSLDLLQSPSRKMNESGFYQLQWRDDDQTFRSDYYRIEVLADQAPKVSILNLSQFTKLKITDAPQIQVTASISDDYQLSDAAIIATVSKGSGESVKFREEKIRFASPAKISGKQIRADQTLNIQKLGLEPGDELYFYVEAFDNKLPMANRSRTETYFIALEDTTRMESFADEGLGVDLMPDYFRSQRQIIIDTEKLLKDKKKITEQAFNFTSNELGFDQKTLRLKYGEFLGEEADSGIGVEATEIHEEEEDEDPLKKFSHQHDTDNEHNLVAEKKTGHDHEHAAKDPNEKEDLLAAFAHNHDDSEVATFFIQSIRTKLKAALTVMWDAELYLRLYQPEKSLPYQYTALKLLKEISNDSRIYVHRTGFDPPPLKEEKRLSADLSEVNSPAQQSLADTKVEFPNIRKAYNLTEAMLTQKQFTISESMQQDFVRAGQEYSALVLENPSLLKGLSLLKSFSENKVTDSDAENQTKELRRFLWRALPAGVSSPSQQQQGNHALDELFLNQLKKPSHE